MVHYRSKTTGKILMDYNVELICSECGEQFRANYEEVEVSIFDLIKSHRTLAAIKMYRDLHPGTDLRVCRDKVDMIREDMRRKGLCED